MTTITTETTTARYLDDAVLEGFRERAGAADRDNTFFQADFEILRDAGYFKASLPEHRGGWGWNLAELGAQQRRLATFAPATALATSMHHYWVGLAADLDRLGLPGGDVILDAVADGKIIAAGHAEAGNDIPVALSSSTARRVDGGWRITGHKQFGSLGPVWDLLGVHAMDSSNPEAPVVVHAFIERTAQGLTVIPRWDTLGMRPSQSFETRLDDVFVPDSHVGAVIPAGDSTHPFFAFMSAWALTLIANVYTGIAQRALELAAHSANTKTSIAIPRGTYAHNPMVQHQIATMFLELDASSTVVDRVGNDWANGVDHGAMWGPKIISAKWRAVEAAKRVVDIALDVTGGAGMMRGVEVERLYRDVRCGGFHPMNDALAHEVLGKTVLGIEPGPDRW